MANKSGRARLGFLIPSANAVIEGDLRRLLPPDITYHVSRVRLQGARENQLREMRDAIPSAVSLLNDVTTSLDAVGFACTAGSMIGGPAYDTEMLALVNTLARRPVVSTSSAVIEALTAVGVTRVALCAPYEGWLTRLEADFLRAKGLEVVAAQALPTERRWEMPASDIAAYVRGVALPPAQAVFASCANFPAAELVPELEARFGIPIITSNQAIIWKLLRLVGVTEAQPALGRLGLCA